MAILKTVVLPVAVSVSIVVLAAFMLVWFNLSAGAFTPEAARLVVHQAPLPLWVMTPFLGFGAAYATYGLVFALLKTLVLLLTALKRIVLNVIA